MPFRLASTSAPDTVLDLDILNREAFNASRKRPIHAKTFGKCFSDMCSGSRAQQAVDSQVRLLRVCDSGKMLTVDISQ